MTFNLLLDSECSVKLFLFHQSNQNKFFIQFDAFLKNQIRVSFSRRESDDFVQPIISLKNGFSLGFSAMILILI